MLKKSLALLAAFLMLLFGVRLTEAYARGDTRAVTARAGEPALLEPESAEAQTREAGASARTVPDTPGYSTKAKGAALIDANTGRVLFAQNAALRLPMASTTKIMTALLTLEQEDLDREFVVDPNAIMVEGSSMGLRKGDTVTLHTLAYGMLLPSGNDAANAAAVRISGSKEAFVGQMNERAAELGLEDTHFANPSGLSDDAHYSSAYDMAQLAREALGNAWFADICSQSKAVVQFGNPPSNRWLTNHNRLLRSFEGTVGVKTGFTDKAGRCLVTCVSRGGVRLIAVTLNCPDDWNEHMKLYNRYFGMLTSANPAEQIPALRFAVTGGGETLLEAEYDPPAPVALLPGETLTATVTLAAPFFYAPVDKGQVLGKVTFTCGGETLGETTLVAKNSVEAEHPGRQSPLEWFERLFS